MKSLLTKIISVLTIAIMCVSLCACGQTTLNEENCDNGHNLVQISYTAPTCKTSGQRISKCSRCEYTETETLLPIPHDYQIKSSTPSTCAKHGSQTVECSMCHETLTNELPLLNHNYELISETSSTCTIKGVKNFKCKDCQDTYSQELELLRHDYKTVNTATCFADGELKNVCNNCQHEEPNYNPTPTTKLTHEFDKNSYCKKCGVYETLFNENELNVTWEGDNTSSVSQYIQGDLKPKFNKNNSIPDEYFNSHTISVVLSFYDNNNLMLESKKFNSFIIPWDGEHKGKPSVQVLNNSNCYSYQFMLFFAYSGIEVFKESTLKDAAAFKLEISCDGYEKIEKTYNISEAH